MIYILIVYIIYGSSRQPHYMGEYNTKDECQKIAEYLKEKHSGFMSGYAGISSYECVEVKE